MKLAILLVVTIIVLAAGGYFLVKTSPFFRSSVMVPTSPQTPESETSMSPAIDNSDLKAGGSSYKDPNDIFTVLYPSDYTLDTSDPKHTRIYKKGPTQTGQTEMYDGVLLVFEATPIESPSLSQWVDTNIKSMTSDDTAKVISPKTSFSVNQYPGFAYRIRSLGEATYYVLQKDANSKYAVVITTSVQDPKNVGFQKDVDKILSTIQILK